MIRNKIIGEQVAPSGPHLTRRLVVGGVLAGALAGCTRTAASVFQEEIIDPVAGSSMYGQLNDEEFPVPAVNLSQVERVYYRRQVDHKISEKPGTIVVDPHNKFLYLVGQNGSAMRYGIGVGRQGFSWNGRAKIGWKRKWPKWTPPAEMIARQPELVKYENGMDPGLDNPLGARALYLFQDGKDTLFRIHGTSEAYSIGRAVSSGCIRLLNQDVIDLYDRAKSGASVIVLGSSGQIAQTTGHGHNG